MSLVQMDTGLLWTGAAAAGAVLGALGHWLAPRQLVWPAAAGASYGALCLLVGPAAVACAPFGTAVLAALLGRGWDARHG